MHSIVVPQDDEQPQPETVTDSEMNDELETQHSSNEGEPEQDDVPAAESPEEEKPKKRRTWKKPADKPKRPLSAYNLFFQYEREKLISNDKNGHASVCSKQNPTLKRRHRKIPGMIGFAELARTISSKWKDIDPETKLRFEKQAAEEKVRYKVALARWRGDPTAVGPQQVEEEGMLSGVRRISLEHSSANHLTTTADAETRGLKNSQRDSLEALMRHRAPSVTQNRPPEVVFFPSLLPNPSGVQSTSQRPSMGAAAASHFARAAAAHQSAARAATIAANCAASQGLYRLHPQVYASHDLALYADLVGRRRALLAMTAVPPDYATLQLLEQGALPMKLRAVNVAGKWPFYL